MVTAYNTFSETRIYIPCPHCEHNQEMGIGRFIALLNIYKSVKCDACKKDFNVIFFTKTRAVEHRNAPDRRGAISDEWLQAVNSLCNIVIDTAGKGYVSSNDLDFANDVLDDVIPLL